MWRLNEIFLAPYMQLATALIGKSRESGGNMFRHQLDTMAILIDYGYIEPVLLKAAVVHDLIEDIPGFDCGRLLSLDCDSHAVYELVLEVTKREGEIKKDFLSRILDHGSHNAKLLKSADRISNMISLGYVNDPEFVVRYTEETVRYVYPIAEQVDKNMLFELSCLVESRRKGLIVNNIPQVQGVMEGQPV
jgi:GTP pyrophosphokinase